MVALILEAHIASLHDPRQYGQILSKSIKGNFDIDATFPDRDSKKIFNFYYNQDNNDETDMDDDQYIDDNDIRRSSLNLSDFHSADPPSTLETEKRPRSHDNDFLKPTKTARRRRTSECTRKSSASSSDGQFWNRKDFEDQQTPDLQMAETRYTVNKSTLTNNDIPVLEQNWNHQRITANLPPTTIPPMPPPKTVTKPRTSRS